MKYFNFLFALTITICCVFYLTGCNTSNNTNNNVNLEDGTIDNPYLINSVIDLKNIQNDMTAYYKLNVDLDFSNIETWLPIGNDSLEFSGNFDGNNHTIKNLELSTKDEETSLSGLFGTISSNGIVSNLNIQLDNQLLTIENSSTTFGYIAAANYGEIKDCCVFGALNIRVIDETIHNGSYPFGIICGVNSNKITDCYNFTDIDLDYSNVNNEVSSSFGAICGYNTFNGRLYDCANIGKINAIGNSDTKSYSSISAICDINYGNIMNCCNYGDIYTSNIFATAGISNSNMAKGTIMYCYNIGDISTSKILTKHQYSPVAAGICTLPDGSIYVCFNDSYISGSSSSAYIATLVNEKSFIKDCLYVDKSSDTAINDCLPISCNSIKYNSSAQLHTQNTVNTLNSYSANVLNIQLFTFYNNKIISTTLLNKILYTDIVEKINNK